MSAEVSDLSTVLSDFSTFVAGDHLLEEVLDRATGAITHGLGVDCHIQKGPLAGAPSDDSRGTSRTIPIDGETAPFGRLVLRTSVPRALSRAEVEFAERIAGLITGWVRHAHYVRDRARLSTVVGAANEAIIGVTKDGRIFSWNEAAKTLCGYQSDDIVGQPAAVLFAGGSQDGLTDALHGCRCEREPFQATLRHRDGTGLAAAVRFAPITLPDGGIAAVYMIAADLAEKRRTDHVIRMHADILAHLPSGVVVWKLTDRHDPSSLTLLLANHAAERLAGCSLNSRIGARFHDLSLDLDGPDPEPYAAVARANEHRDFGDRTVTRADRSRTVCRVEAFPLPEQCVGVVFHDVTERRDLADQLHHAQRLEVVGRLTGGIAHDFNNLLTVITGYSELLRPAIANHPAAADDLDQIAHASNSAQELTQQLLAFGRRQHLQPTSTTLSALVEGTRKMIERLIGEDIQLIVLNQDPVAVCVDIRQLEQVLLNLAINARDAMPAGGKIFIESNLVRVSTSSGSGAAAVPPGVYGVLQFTDTGIGMDRATLDRIFEPFFTTKEPGKGTGLGLSTVYGIVKQSGGHVTVHSEPGEGTTFKLFLPAIEAPVDAPFVEPASVVEPHTGTQTVLLVDDDESVAFLLQRVLSRAGYQVLTASSSDEALRIAEEGTVTVDLLITDVVLPLQSGTELAARLIPKFPSLQVLFMSGYLPESHGHRALPPNAILLAKPFSPGELLESVRRTLAPSTKRGRPRPQSIM